MKSRLFVFSMAVGAMLASSALAQTNYKIRQVMSVQGQKVESTVYVRGSRKRTEQAAVMGYGGDVATVEQCDMKRDLKISDKKRLYAIDPYAADTGSAPSAPVSRGSSQPKTKGGVVTYISNITDTGERKQMFGMTARHLKTSMTVETSPDACSPQDMRMDSDGWYIDLPEFSCPTNFRPQMPDMGTRGGGCQDTMHYRTTGGGKLGFALQETRTMSMGGGMTMTTSTDTLDFSKAPLDAGLFDIPQGYTLTANEQELYGKPDVDAMMRGMKNGGDDNMTNPPQRPIDSQSTNMGSGAKRPGVIRIGVVAPMSRSSENVSTAELQTYLAGRLSGGNIEAVPIGSEADARGMGCDYVLVSDISKLKQSTAGKIGGMFGKVTSTGVGGGGYDVQVDYKLTSAADSRSIVTSKASNGKANASSAQGAVEGVLNDEAAAVIAGIVKN